MEFTLKQKLWQYLSVFASSLMLILWLFEIIFLKTYYEGMKVREIERIGNQLVSEYGRDGFDSLVYQFSYSYGLMVRLFDEQGNVLLISNNFGEYTQNSEIKQPMWEVIRNTLDFKVIKTAVDNLDEDSKGYVAFTKDSDNIRISIAVYGSKLLLPDGKSIYFLINSPITQMEATTSILQTQLIMVTIIALFFALILSYFIAKRLSTPIASITQAAKKLGQGDYSVEFKEGGFSEVDELAKVLNYTTKELSRTDELRRDLMANVTHDLRTPLTIIKSYAEMIRDISGENKEKRLEHTKVIIDEADRLTMLVNDILDLSKLEAGTEKLSYSEFNISDTVKSILLRFNYLAECKGYTIHMDIAQDCRILGDERKLEQVIYNLIGNAINYTGPDKSVSVQLKKLDGKVKFSVTDTGKGIAKEDLSRVWERYYTKSHKHTRSGFESFGTGVGLSIVKSILSAHHAEFGVESTLGVGSTFWFMIE